LNPGKNWVKRNVDIGRRQGKKKQGSREQGAGEKRFLPMPNAQCPMPNAQCPTITN
jgi:hypothetical protein